MIELALVDPLGAVPVAQRARYLSSASESFSEELTLMEDSFSFKFVLLTPLVF
jgi:hypothetical protein